MDKLKKLTILIAFAFLGNLAQAQITRTIDSLMAVPLIQVNYAFDIPGADLAKRYGFNHELGVGFFYKSKKGWLFGVEGSFMFGDQVRGDSAALQPLFTKSGKIIGKDSQSSAYYPNYRTSMRGFKIPQFKVGKLFHKPILKGSANSGPFIMVGAGFMQYFLNIEDVDRTIPQIGGDYIKGYDHLTNGLTTTQSIGYLYLDKHKLLNISLSFEFMQGYTQNRRDWNADTRSPENHSRLDLMYGFKLSWYVPIYPKLASGYYYH